jgi:hypothetical protein
MRHGRALKWNILDRYWDGEAQSGIGSKVFVTAFDTDTTMGVLRQQIMKMNSTVKCRHIEQLELPSSCPGISLFTAMLSAKIRMPSMMHVCVPSGGPPWTVSRNRQDPTKDMYAALKWGLLESHVPLSITIHCQARTTRGHFELGNYRNNNTYGTLLEKRPSPIEIPKNFNDNVETRPVSESAGRTWFRPSAK